MSDDRENVGNLIKALQDFGFVGFDLSGLRSIQIHRKITNEKSETLLCNMGTPIIAV